MRVCLFLLSEDSFVPTEKPRLDRLIGNFCYFRSRLLIRDYLRDNFFFLQFVIA